MLPNKVANLWLVLGRCSQQDFCKSGSPLLLVCCDKLRVHNSNSWCMWMHCIDIHTTVLYVICVHSNLYILYETVWGVGSQLPAIVVDRNVVDSVDSFIFLGSVFPPTVTIAQISTNVLAGHRRWRRHFTTSGRTVASHSLPNPESTTL